MFEKFRQIKLNSIVWKFHEFFINQTLREIITEESRGSKTTILAIKKCKKNHKSQNPKLLNVL